ncbi:PEP-CTERM sorting domain-containing protein [bacterium]|nr:MAG: PEP-CTERM sorting domain-containing protein [bacterium]
MIISRSRFAVLAALTALAVTADGQVPLPSIKTHTEAHYQGDFAADDNGPVNFPVGALPAVSESRSSVLLNGYVGYGGRTGVAGMPDIQGAWDDADAYARGQLPGNDGVYARAGGYTPSHMPGPSTVNALASVELYRNYLVGGSGVVPIDLTTFFEGFLYVTGFSTVTADLDARVSIAVSMDGSLFSGDLFRASGTLDGFSGFSTTGAVAGGHSLAGFVSAWQNTTATLTSTNASSDKLWELDYLESFNNIASAQAGETIGLRYTIEVQANNNIGPYEIFSTADFSHSFKFGLGTSDPNSSVTEINVVPEPATCFLLGSGLIVLMRRRAIDGAGISGRR